MLKISFFCLKYWLGSWRKRTSLKHGQRSHGQFGVLETSFILSELKLIQKKIMIVKWAFSKSTRGIWLLNILKRVVWPSCSICGPPIYYFFHTAMFCLCQHFGVSLVQFFQIVLFKKHGMKLSFFKSRVFGKNYQKVLLKKTECLANTYKRSSLSCKLPKRTRYI